MNTSEIQEQRAKNIIWNAAGDYSFLPDFVSFDEKGEADLYFNCIIGSVYRFYDYRPIHDLFLRMGRMPEAALYRSLLWLGLEQCTYEKALPGRPALASLRLDYARRVSARSRSYWDQELFDRLNTAHFTRLLGETPRLSKKEQRLLAALEFSSAMDAEAIVMQMCWILKKFFHCNLPRLNEKNRRFQLPIHIRRAALRGSVTCTPSLSEGNSSTRPARKGLTLYVPALSTGVRPARLRTWLEDSFGLSLYDSGQLQELEQKLCRESHRGCHLHVTRGEFRKEASLKSSGSSLYRALRLQQERNLRFFREHLSRNMLSISRLTDRIRNILITDTGGSPLLSRTGNLLPERIWRAEKLHDDRAFSKNDPSDKGNLSVDILLDASASQRDRQERIASQGYIIAESLSRCNLPVRVSSYCTVNGCTVLHMFRDYTEPQYNDRIFQYLSTGWNRDGLAVRITGERLWQSDYENRLLIILSDCSPNDDRRMFSREGRIPFYYDYGGPRGIQDTAREVSRLRRQGVSVLAVCTGRERDLKAARQIYGKDVVWAQSEERFADAVGYLLQEKLRNL